MDKWVLGLIGGSGVYDIELDSESEWRTMSTQWGEPSDQLRFGSLEGIDVVFLPRHSRGHKIPPHKINYRANIAALKQAGASDIISLSACGSFQAQMKPGEFVVVEQFVDRTSAMREKSFFDAGVSCYAPLAEPVSARLSGYLAQALEKSGATYHQAASYLAMEGPQFSTRAESKLHKSWGLDVVGMTNMPEAKLAREAELPYATLGMITDFDSWSEEGLDIARLLEIMGRSVQRAKEMLRHFAKALPRTRTADPQGIETTLDSAIITAKESLPPDFARRYAPIVNRFVKGHPNG